MTSKLLTAEQVHAIGMAALDNAVDLMADVDALRKAQRPRRAYCLGVIAVEEVAKYWECRQALEAWTSKLTARELNARLRPRDKAHVKRYTATLERLDALGTVTGRQPEGWENMEEMARADMEAREAALYVEIGANGDPLTPDRVSEAEAREWVGEVIGILAMMEIAWRPALSEALEKARSGHSS